MDVPYLTDDLPGIGGSVKQRPEDFIVEELPAYEPSGHGEHLFLWIEKRDLAPEQLKHRLVRGLGIPPNDVGMAGLKDRRAITRQYVSVPAGCEDRMAGIDAADLRVLRAARHGNKLRTGHLRGNRFWILVRDVESASAFDRAQAVAERIARMGCPNYFGEQRFGREDETRAIGMDLLRGRKKPRDLPGDRRFLLRLSLSAVQSWLFNRALAERLADGLLHRVLTGDVMQVVASGGLFLAEDLDAEQRRYDAAETAVTGPMFGPKMRAPGGEPAERERRILEASGFVPEDFRRFPRLTSGTRRPFLIRPRELSVSPDPDGVRFAFTLPAGAYATVVLREFQKGPAS